MSKMVLVNPYSYQCDMRGKVKWSSSKALNFGLLSIANYLHKKEIKVDILDLQDKKNPSDQLEKYITKQNPKFVGIGCISALSYLPTLEIAKYVKKINPEIYVGIGGQHTRFIIEDTFRECGAIDIIATGEGEKTTEQIYSWLNKKIGLSDVKGIAFRGNDNVIITPQNEPVNLNELSPTKYDLYPDYENFFPLVEDSRGCPYGCSFCSNKYVYDAKIRFKDPKLVLEEIHNIAETYGAKSLPLVFYNSFFGGNPKITKEILKGLKEFKFDIEFLTATRVDSNWKLYIPELEGLRGQIHLGLESASPEILIRMKKTFNPKKYLEFAKNAIREFYQKNIFVTLNIITGFCGENKKTLADTKEFLEENREYIGNIWSHSLMMYPGSRLRNEIGEFQKKFGSRLRRNEFYDRIHAYPIDATSKFTFEDARKYEDKLMQEFNTFEKAYEYYKWYVGPIKDKQSIKFISEEKFMELLKGEDKSKLGFKLPQLRKFQK